MLGEFTYCNPTRLYFGKNALENLKTELAKYGSKIMLTYGKGSIKKYGIYDEVIKILKDCGKEIIEDGGVMPNPTLNKLIEGAKIAKDNSVDLILAVGGGSVCVYAKAVAVSAYCEEDIWEKYFERMEDVDNKIIPVACVLTMVGTGSEMNGGSVITNEALKHKKTHTFDDRVFPKFAILNPEYSYTLPKYQMVAGIYDIFNHLCEQYFSGNDDNTSDYLAEGMMNSLIHASYIALKNPYDYEARSNIMWTATWALNTLTAKGKTTDWMVHMLGKAIGAYTDATHGMTLSVVSLPYYRHILPSAIAKFKRFAINVWHVETCDKDDLTIAQEGLKAMEKWMNDLGLQMHAEELGLKQEMIDEVATKVIITKGGYKTLDLDDIKNILQASL